MLLIWSISKMSMLCVVIMPLLLAQTALRVQYHSEAISHWAQRWKTSLDKRPYKYHYIGNSGACVGNKILLSIYFSIVSDAKNTRASESRRYFYIVIFAYIFTSSKQISKQNPTKWEGKIQLVKQWKQTE